MKSLTELINQSLVAMNAAGTGQPIQAEDSAKVLEILPGLLDELNDAGDIAVTYAADDLTTQVVPNKIFNALANMLALDAAPSVMSAPFPTDDQREEMKKPLRRIAAIKPTYGTLATDYF